MSVLVVDDHPAQRAYARCVFEALGCEVFEAADGIEGVGLADLQRFDLILMDRYMPRCDGDMATRRIRTGDGPSASAVILCHSVEPPPGQAAALYDRFIAKPITTYQVLDLIPGKPKPQRFKFDVRVRTAPTRVRRTRAAR
ncbi:MAG TPA: response regulator [Caulobacteraceae bacterium]|jgi:CheY-like chemotaxis protein